VLTYWPISIYTWISVLTPAFPAIPNLCDCLSLLVYRFHQSHIDSFVSTAFLSAIANTPSTLHIWYCLHCCFPQCTVICLCHSLAYRIVFTLHPPLLSLFTLTYIT
jgi:hypothetical protein